MVLSRKFCSYNGPISHGILVLQLQTVEEHFTMTPMMTKISPESLRMGELICIRSRNIVGGGPK